MKNTKKKRTAIIFTLCATIIGWLIWGNTSIKTTDIQVTDSRLPNGFGGFTVVRVSDLHNAEFGKGRDERYTETGGVFNKTDISEINQSLNEM